MVQSSLLIRKCTTISAKTSAPLAGLGTARTNAKDQSYAPTALETTIQLLTARTNPSATTVRMVTTSPILTSALPIDSILKKSLLPASIHHHLSTAPLMPGPTNQRLPSWPFSSPCHNQPSLKLLSLNLRPSTSLLISSPFKKVLPKNLTLRSGFYHLCMLPLPPKLRITVSILSMPHTMNSVPRMV